MLEKVKNIIEAAEKNNYAVGAFNVHGLESVLGVARAAASAKSPAIIQVSEGAIKYMGLETVVELVRIAATTIASDVPIGLHLDHGKNKEIVLACIEAGFSSVHMDGSHLPLEENIKVSKEIVEYAHAKDVWVQGEVGAIMGGHGDNGGIIEDIPIAKLEEVEQFVKETGVDTIAAAVGTAHGVYDNEDILIDLLESIKSATKIPFILHGGSGVKQEKILESLKHGVNVINIGSDIKIAFSERLIQNCAENPKETDPRNLLGPSIDAIEKVTVEQMELFGSAGRA